jgi:hypothetical protein
LFVSAVAHAASVAHPVPSTDKVIIRLAGVRLVAAFLTALTASV